MDELEYKLQLAEDFEKENKLMHALQIYQNLLDEKNYKRKACIKLAGVFEKLNRIDSAMKTFRRYLDEETDDIDMQKYVSHFLIRNKMYEDALEILDTVEREQNPEIYYLLGIANFNMKDYRIAKINFNTFLERSEINELRGEAHLYLTLIDIDLEDYDGALENAKKADALLLNNLELFTAISKIYYHKGMYFHAYDSIRRALKIKSRDPSLHEFAGKILYKLGDYNKAEEHLKVVLELSDPNSNLLSLLGMTCLNINKSEEANLYFSEALKKNPADKVALMGKAKCDE